MNPNILLDYRGAHTPPHYATQGAAGLDLSANLEEPLCLAPGALHLISTGLWVTLPLDIELQIRSRSGLAVNHGLAVFNQPGTVDSDYANEVKVLLKNYSPTPYTIQPGERIAQGVFSRVEHAAQGYTIHTKTRAGGFGSTGTHANE